MPQASLSWCVGFSRLLALEDRLLTITERLDTSLLRHEALEDRLKARHQPVATLFPVQCLREILLHVPI